MIRKFEHGVLCLTRNDKKVSNIFPKVTGHKVWFTVSALADNQVFKDHNPLLAPRVLADWTYQ